MSDITEGIEEQSIEEIRILARGAGTVFFGTVISVVLKYAFELFLARNLGPSLFGVFFLGFTIFRILERISVFGLHNGVIRYVSIYNGVDDRDRLKGTILLSIISVSIISVIICAIILPLSRLISGKIFDDISLTPVLIIFTSILAFNAVSEMMLNTTQGFQIMKFKTLVRSIVEPALRLVLAVAFIFIGWSLLGAALAYAISLLAGLILAYFFLKKTFPAIAERKQPYIFETRKILGYSWPLAFVGFFNVVMFQVNTIMLGYFSTSGDIGIFGAVQRTSFAIMVIQTSFAPILAPIVADLFHRNKLKNLERHFKITTNWVFMVSFPMFLLIMLFPGELLSIWGKGYDAGWLGLIIIAVSMIINCSVGQVKAMIMMTGKSRLNLLNDGTAFILAIILNILLIPRYGYLGASISFAAAVFAVNIMGFIEVYILLKMHPYKLSILKPVAAGIIVFSIIFIIKRYIFNGSASIIWLISLIAIFLVLYVGLLLVFRLNQEDKVVINMIRSGLRFRSSVSANQ